MVFKMLPRTTVLRTACFGKARCSLRAAPIRVRQVRALGVEATVTAAAPVLDDQDAAKLAVLEAKFRALDVDGNGSIDKEELRLLLESTQGGDAVMFTEHWLPDDELDRVLEQYDTNKNGLIEFDEFKQIVYDGLLLDGKLSEYEEAFKAVDSSGNGSIGATELAQMFAALGNPMSYDNLVRIFEKYDKDESGQIEFKEFLLMFRDQLLDLKDVWQYMALNTKAGKGDATEAVLDHPEGDVPLIFSESEFEEVLEGSTKGGKALVLFSALTWCRPCKGMQRPAQRLAEQYKETTNWVKIFGNVNAQTKQLFKERFKIRSTPCFMVFKDGQLVYTQTGSNKQKLEEGLRAALGGDDNPALPKSWLYTAFTQ